jgi:amino acid adenylation domain-containing protein
MSNRIDQIKSLSPKKRELFQLLMEKRKKSDAAVAAPITRSPRSGPLPLSFAQQRLWFLDQWQPGSSVYNLTGCLRLIGSLNSKALGDAISEIWRRHEALRTTFPTIDGQPVQFIKPAEPLTIARIDISEFLDDDQEQRLQQVVQQASQHVFDLVRGPLFTSSLVRLSAEHHVLVLVMHHIVNDGWSAGLFGRELSLLYKAFVAGEASPLPELKIQYADFAQWQRNWLQGEVLDTQISYWRKQLAGAPDTITLPLDFSRSAMQSFNGSREPLVLPERLTSQLRALSRQHEVTLFMTLLAAFQVLLSRYSGQTDVVVGSPVAGRNRPETEELIGLFVNTLAFRCDLAGDPTFIEVLRRVRNVTLDAYAHQDLPFEKLVEELHPARDLSRPALFQVLFVLQNVDTQPFDLPGLKILPMASEIETAKFDLSLYLWDAATKLEGYLEFNTDLFEPATVRRLLAHFTTLLENLVATPELPLSAVSMISELEVKELRELTSPPAISYSADLCVYQLFEQQAERTPDAVALIHDHETRTYRELNQQSNALAHHLRALGVGPETLVGLCVERGISMVIGLLGIMKAGGAYVPLDPSYPQDRLSWMLEDTALKILVTEEQLVQHLPDTGHTQLVFLDGEWPRQVENPEPQTHPNHLAYVIYTSGSTGKPKGVMIEHGALTNFISSMQRLSEIGPSDVLLGVTTLGFDIAGLEMFLPLTVGARLAIAGEETVIDGRALLAEIERRDVTVMQATPVTWRLLIDAGWSGSPRMLALCGGEALSRDLADKLLERTRELWNMYGPTETTIWSSAAKVEKDNGPVFIGGPIDNTQILILDENLQMVPFGVPGEIYIGGGGVARGYLNRPELTAERFMAYSLEYEAASVRLYRTGDLARYRATGQIEFLGRVDQQVKIRGHRIEPGEIEALLRDYPDLIDAVVVAKGEGAEKRLVAYVVYAEGLAVDELRPYLLAKLPEYMVPSVFVKMQQLPLTPNGKINRKSLPAPANDRADLKVTYSPPRSELEQNIAEIWQGALQVEKVGRDDTFFDLGGHSLLMAQVRSSLSANLGLELSIVELFKYPTVGTLAEHIAHGQLDQDSGQVQHRALTRLESLKTQRRQRQLR